MADDTKRNDDGIFNNDDELNNDYQKIMQTDQDYRLKAKQTLQKSVTGFEKSIREARETILEIIDPDSTLNAHLKEILEIKPTELYSRRSHQLLTAGPLPLPEIQNVMGNLSFWRFFSDSDFYKDMEPDLERINPIAIELQRKLFMFTEKFVIEHYRLLADIDAGERSTEGLGITEEELAQQKAHQFSSDLLEIYEFMYSINAKTYRRRKDENKTAVSTGLFIANDHITNALTRRGDNHIAPQDYFSGEYVRVNSGLGGYTELLVTTDSDINEVYENYQLSDRFRYWADAYYALAFENPGEPIRGTEILERNGYSNPYDPSATKAIEDAIRNLDKGIRTRIATDVSNEVIQGKKKNAYRRNQAIKLQPIIDGKITLEEWTDDKGKKYKDFSISLNGSPDESLPLANLAAERHQLARATEEEITFHTIPNLDTDDRQIWRYILRQLKEKKTSNNIYFSTMWKTLELKEPEYLKPILDEKGNPVLETIIDKDGNPKTGKDGKPKTREKKLAMTYQDAKNEILADPKLDRKAKDKQLAALERKRKIAINSQRNRKTKKLEAMLDEAQTDRGISCYSKNEITFPKKIKAWKPIYDGKNKWVGIAVTPLPKSKTEEQEEVLTKE